MKWLSQRIDPLPTPTVFLRDYIEHDFVIGQTLAETNTRTATCTGEASPGLRATNTK